MFINDCPDGIILCDKRGTIQVANDAVNDCFGYLPGELIGQKVEVLIPERFRSHEKLRQDFMQDPASRPMGTIQRIFGKRKDGTEVPLDIALKVREGGEGIICFVRDISEHFQLTEEVRKLGYFDPITGALNRRAFNEDLAEKLAGLEEEQSRFCVALFDLDHFKDVNDTLGHTVGDQLLVTFCERLLEVMDKEMRLYRVGGDEFALLIPDCSMNDNPVAFVESALWNVRKSIRINGHEIIIGCSAGVVAAPENGRTLNELLSNADLALYEAKRVRGRVSQFTPSLRAAAEERFKLLSELQVAVQETQFELFYQPQIDLRSGRIAGAEALLRWRHPERGLIAPQAFIELLAESDLSISVGRWVLNEACRQARIWENAARRPIRIAVNLFPRQTHSKSLVNDVMHALNVSRLDPATLELELTENTIMDSAADSFEVLQYLRDLGVTIALDDFGTGYASLKSLTSYPVDTIKVDRGFVFDAKDKKEKRAVLQAVIMLAREFGLASVAEGVESAEDVLIVEKLGFEMAQGYSWSRPLSASDFQSFLSDQAA